jgi:Flp pilus assembly pilin Flp
MGKVLAFVRDQRAASTIEYALVGLGIVEAIVVFFHTLSAGDQSVAGMVQSPRA